jgi:hypothetical protein
MRVDVVTYNSLHSLLRDQILAEQIEILWIRTLNNLSQKEIIRPAELL